MVHLPQQQKKTGLVGSRSNSKAIITSFVRGALSYLNVCPFYSMKIAYWWPTRATNRNLELISASLLWQRPGMTDRE